MGSGFDAAFQIADRAGAEAGAFGQHLLRERRRNPMLSQQCRKGFPGLWGVTHCHPCPAVHQFPSMIATSYGFHSPPTTR